MAGTVDKKVAAQVTRHAAASFKRLLDVGMPARTVAATFMPVVLALMTKAGGPQNSKDFLALIRKDVASEAQQMARKQRKALPASRPVPPIVGTLNDIRDLKNYGRDSIYRVIDLGFDAPIVLLCFGQCAVQVVINSEGYDAALAWLDELSRMIDLPLIFFK
jgi:hypothetical protein